MQSVVFSFLLMVCSVSFATSDIQIEDMVLAEEHYDENAIPEEVRALEETNNNNITNNVNYSGPNDQYSANNSYQASGPYNKNAAYNKNNQYSANNKYSANDKYNANNKYSANDKYSANNKYSAHNKYSKTSSYSGNQETDAADYSNYTFPWLMGEGEDDGGLPLPTIMLEDSLEDEAAEDLE